MCKEIISFTAAETLFPPTGKNTFTPCNNAKVDFCRYLKITLNTPIEYIAQICGF